MCEALWSDPSAVKGRTPSKRGVGVCFGACPPRLRPALLCPACPLLPSAAPCALGTSSLRITCGMCQASSQKACAGMSERARALRARACAQALT